MRILIAEDEPKTSTYLKKGLIEQGFMADAVTDGEDAVHQALTVPYDLIILDVMLPGKDGWSVLAEIRGAGLATPVLFLTARDTLSDRLKGLDGGADDYLVKPFSFAELLARVRAVLRRSPALQGDVFRLSDLEMDFRRHRVVRGGQALDLTPREFALLSLLARRSGEVLSRTLIAEQVWDMNFDSDSNVVDVAVLRLRRKVDEPFAIRLIHTVRGVGYVLEGR